LTIDGAAPTLRAMARETAEESGMNYARCPDGWLLAHNIVRPEAANTRNGWKGFRRLWISPKKKKKDGWKLCKCGWRPDLGPHYSGLAEKAE
jgi:hypothetical protein